MTTRSDSAPRPPAVESGRDPELDALTPRERELVEHLVSGRTTDRELGAALGVARNTLKYHVRNVLAKLGLRNRAQVAVFVLRRRFEAARADSAQRHDGVQEDERAHGDRRRAQAGEEQERDRMSARRQGRRLDQEPGDEEAAG